jgi:hypothetical protein
MGNRRVPPGNAIALCQRAAWANHLQGCGRLKLILTRHEQAASESYGAIGHRVKRTDDLVPTMEAAFKDSGVHLVTVRIDYAEDTRVLVEELRGRVPELA